MWPRPWWSLPAEQSRRRDRWGPDSSAARRGAHDWRQASPTLSYTRMPTVRCMCTSPALAGLQNRMCFMCFTIMSNASIHILQDGWPGIYESSKGMPTVRCIYICGWDTNYFGPATHMRLPIRPQGHTPLVSYIYIYIYIFVYIQYMSIWAML